MFGDFETDCEVEAVWHVESIRNIVHEEMLTRNPEVDAVVVLVDPKHAFDAMRSQGQDPVAGAAADVDRRCRGYPIDQQRHHHFRGLTADVIPTWAVAV